MGQPQPFNAIDRETVERVDVCRALFEASPLAILVADDQGRYIEVNPAACELLDAPREELIGRSITDFVLPQRTFEIDWSTFLARRSQSGEIIVMREGGEQRTVRYRAVADFVPGLHVSFLEDISEEHALIAEREHERTLFEGVLNRMPAGVAVVEAPEGKVVFTNEAFARVLRHPVWSEGLSEYARYGGRHRDGRPYRPEEYPAARSLLHGEVVQREDIGYEFGDGTRGILSVASSPIYDAQGAIVAAVVLIEDVSKQRERRALLEASEAHFRTLADSLPIVIWAEDEAGRVDYLNRHWFEYTGRASLPPGSPELQNWAGAIHPDDLKQHLEYLARVYADGGEIRTTLRIRRSDGVYRAHACVAIPIHDEHGRVVRRLGSANDIQDQRDAIEALHHERDLRERFVASLSHDLRSPLTAAKMGAQLLMRNTDRPDRLQLQASRVIRNIDRADQLIQNLLDVTRISAGEPLVLERTTCDISAIARDILEDQTTVHGDRFVLDAPPSVSGFYDETALRRIFENLLGNAVKYGEPHTKIIVSITESATDVRLTVHNEGRAIPPEEQATIFQPYQRAVAGAQRSVGWGLGLTLVRGIAEAHGGTALVQSTPNTGTTFAVSLPRVVSEEKA